MQAPLALGVLSGQASLELGARGSQLGPHCLSSQAKAESTNSPLGQTGMRSDAYLPHARAKTPVWEAALVVRPAPATLS